MMTKQQYLLMKVAEECNEVAQRAIKAARFGMDEIQDGQPYDNATRLMDEFLDLTAAMAMLEGDTDLEAAAKNLPDNALDLKIERVKKYLDYSRSRGMVE